MKENKGITLVALIITIIVMMILVGVSVAMLINSDLLGTAKNAGASYRGKMDHEQGMGTGDVQIGDKTMAEYLAQINGGQQGGENPPSTDITNPCEHSYTEEITKQASCIEEGSTTKTCTKCGATEVTEIEKTAHTYGTDNICTICGEEKVAFATTFGTIEVVWINKENEIIEEPLAPNLGDGMTAKVYNGTDWVEPTSTNWYNYQTAKDETTGAEIAPGMGDNTTSQWANATTEDGSYWVWIPRYAYRITYYNNKDLSAETTKISGYCDGRGIVDVDENIQYTLDAGIKTVIDENTGKNYIVHPTFMKDDIAGDGYPAYSHGGWSEDLSGIWVAKFEMSDNNGIPISTYNVKAKTDINVANCYITALGYDETIEYANLDSHLMKNSEWGAVAYLTHSQYGRNGEGVTQSNSSYTNRYRTGGGNYASNLNQSSTGNIYGVYDLNGGAEEYIADFNLYSYDDDYFGGENGNSSSKYKPTTGQHYAFLANGEGDKYYSVYSNRYSSNAGSTVYSVGKIGDSTKEVFDGFSNEAWDGNTMKMVSPNYPFFSRDDGIFTARDITAGGNAHQTYRVCLAPSGV